MVYRGHVENGVIRLEDAPTLREGTEVEVRLLTENVSAEEEAEIPCLYERLKDVVGKAEGLPADLAMNHDHYLHGRARQ
jgi:predicted DNA-binding antitoxin AbrB/MazE fold protein